MTKQELATRIWATANELRKNIKASEYKDYILGFMFYKYLSDKELDYFKDRGGESEEDLIDLDIEVIDMARDVNGYFIAYEDLFSVWRKKGIHLGARDVSDSTIISAPDIRSFLKISFPCWRQGLQSLERMPDPGTVRCAALWI